MKKEHTRPVHVTIMCKTLGDVTVIYAQNAKPRERHADIHKPTSSEIRICLYH